MKNKKYFLDHMMPFKERCDWIDFHDTIYLEFKLHYQYREWVALKIEEAEKSKDKVSCTKLKVELDLHVEHSLNEGNER